MIALKTIRFLLNNPVSLYLLKWISARKRTWMPSLVQFLFPFDKPKSNYTEKKQDTRVTEPITFDLLKKTNQMRIVGHIVFNKIIFSVSPNIALLFRQFHSSNRNCQCHVSSISMFSSILLSLIKLFYVVFYVYFYFNFW